MTYIALDNNHSTFVVFDSNNSKSHPVISTEHSWDE